MRTTIILLLVATYAISCISSSARTEALQERVRCLEDKLAQAYRPGFGDFMSRLQVHHAKLWFAGQAGNWSLAAFERHELDELIQDIRQFKADRKETPLLSILQPALDSIDQAIKSKNSPVFKESFSILTNGCNACHRATDHGFTIMTIPTDPPFSNQVFKMKTD
jgi:hypothetical protein